MKEEFGYRVFCGPVGECFSSPAARISELKNAGSTKSDEVGEGDGFKEAGNSEQWETPNDKTRKAWSVAY